MLLFTKDSLGECVKVTIRIMKMLAIQAGIISKAEVMFSNIIKYGKW